MYPQPTVSVVLGSYNRHALLKAALESVRSNGMDFPYEIIVVDGGSTDGSLKYLAAQKDIITIIQHNHGTFRGTNIEHRSWGYFMNLGFKVAQAKYILMISDDCLLVPGALKNGITLFEELLTKDQKIGAMAFYWRNWPEQKEYWVGLTLGMKMFVNHGLFLRAAVEEVGWIDEQTYQFYHADGDLCLKLWHNNYSVVDCKTAFVEHYNHLKPNPVSSRKDWEAYLEKWGGIFYDPQKKNEGGWLYQSYSDPNMIFQNFPASARIQIGLKKPQLIFRKIAGVAIQKVKRLFFPKTYNPPRE